MGAIRPRNAWGDYREVGGVEFIPVGGRALWVNISFYIKYQKRL